MYLNSFSPVVLLCSGLARGKLRMRAFCSVGVWAAQIHRRTTRALPYSVLSSEKYCFDMLSSRDSFDALHFVRREWVLNNYLVMDFARRHNSRVNKIFSTVVKRKHSVNLAGVFERFFVQHSSLIRLQLLWVCAINRYIFVSVWILCRSFILKWRECDMGGIFDGFSMRKTCFYRPWESNYDVCKRSLVWPLRLCFRCCVWVAAVVSCSCFFMRCRLHDGVWRQLRSQHSSMTTSIAHF